MVELAQISEPKRIRFADIVGSSGKVYAFEPLPSNVRALREICGLNKSRNIEVYPVAVGNHCETVLFSVPPALSSGTGSVNWSGRNQSETIAVDCITLDSLFPNAPSVKMIFIDAEGAEVRILMGAEKLIEHRKPAIVLEASSEALALAGHSLLELRQTIHSLGYETFIISRLGLMPLRISDSIQHFDGNWFCVHESNVGCTKRASRLIRMCAMMPCVRGLNPITRCG